MYGEFSPELSTRFGDFHRGHGVANSIHPFPDGAAVDLKTKYPDASEAELEALQKALDSLSGQRHDRFAEAYHNRRRTLEKARHKLHHGGWYGAHLYYLGSGCTGMLYTATLGGMLVIWMIDRKRGDNRLRKGIEIANLGIIQSILPTYRRQEEAFQRHGNNDIAEAIAKETFVRGMTGEQLTESMGRPRSVERRTVDGREQEVWQYEPQEGASTGVDVVLEEGKIVSWERK